MGEARPLLQLSVAVVELWCGLVVGSGSVGEWVPQFNTPLGLELLPVEPGVPPGNDSVPSRATPANLTLPSCWPVTLAICVDTLEVYSVSAYYARPGLL